MLSLPTVEIATVQPVTSYYTSAAVITVSRFGSDNSGALNVSIALGGNASTNDYSVSGGSYSASGGYATMTIPATESGATLTISSLGGAR